MLHNNCVIFSGWKYLDILKAENESISFANFVFSIYGATLVQIKKKF